MTAIVTCAVAGCGQARRKRGWCDRHYQAWRRNGDPVGAKHGWAAKGGICLVCGSPELMAGSRRYCSRACSQTATRARNAGMAVREYLARRADVTCNGCGDSIRVVATSRGTVIGGQAFEWCEECRAQRQKHGISAKMLARRDGTDCGICDEPIDMSLRAPDPLSPSIDRIIARVRGGSDDPENLQLAHRRCNQSKGDLLPAERAVRHCAVLGCERRLHNRAMGLCKAHMSVYYKHHAVPPEYSGRKAYVRLAQ